MSASRAAAVLLASLALAACGDATTLRSPSSSDVRDDAAAGDEASAPDASAIADASTDADPLAPPGVNAAGVYIPFETLPPRDRSGALVDVSGTDAQDVAGAVGRAIHPGTTTLSFAGDAADIGTGDFTIAVWVRLVSSADQPILDKRIEAQPKMNLGYFLAVQSTKIVFQMASDSVPTEVFHSAGEIHGDCDWHLIVVAVNRRQTFGGRLYFDAKVVRTFVDTDATLTNGAPLRIGSTHFGDGRFLGDIDELMITGEALTEAAITTYYNAVRARLPAPDHC